jgi:hypothetical protein
MKSSSNPLDSLSVEEQNILLNNDFHYIQAKAEIFLRIGSTKYRKSDALGEPRKTTSKAVLLDIKSVCNQIAEGLGFTSERCISEVDMRGFYAAMRMFHFEETDRQTKHCFNYKGRVGALDVMTFAHLVRNSVARMFVFYAYENGDCDRTYNPNPEDWALHFKL